MSQFRLHEVLNAEGPWSYSSRIPEGGSSRAYSIVPLLAATLLDGLGIFFANDLAKDTPFWSNVVVWFGLLHAALCVGIWAWMFWGRWAWTAQQMALFGIVAGFVPVLFAFQGATFTSFLAYGEASMAIKIWVASVVLAWHGYWIRQAVIKCFAIWNDPILRGKVWARYDGVTIYRRSAAKAAMDKVGLRFHPGGVLFLLPVLLCIPIYVYREQLASQLGISPMPMMGFVLGLAIFVLASVALAVSAVMMVIIPARIVSETGGPVLIDMVTRADVPGRSSPSA